MFISREVFHCKPGHAKEIVAIFKQAAPVFKEMGLGDLTIMTDVSGQPYWTVVIEQEVKSLDEFANMARTTMSDPRISTLLKGYHEHVVGGKRELFKKE